MSARVTLHLGPPKTATTSLQIALGALSHPGFHFAGTLQPRTRNKGSLCDRLFRLCSAHTPLEPEATALRAELRALREQGQSVFLSEEMFLLERDSSPVAHRITRLGVVLAGLECRILISARPGKSALASFFQEVFDSLPFALQQDFAAFCEDPRARCYDYLEICAMLSRAGLSDIALVEFTSLTRAPVDLGKLTGADALRGVTVTLARSNEGPRGQAAEERVLPGLSLTHLGRTPRVAKALRALKLRDWPGYGALHRGLARIRLRPGGPRALVVPPEIAARFDAAYAEALARYGCCMRAASGGHE